MPGKGKGPGGGGGSGGGKISGNRKDNVLVGTAGDDWITGKEGADVLAGGLGDDTLDGGADDDILIGDEGSVAADGTVTLLESPDDGDDFLSGGAGKDQLYGNGGSDRLFGGEGDDLLAGGSGDDELQGGAGIDTLDGGDGTDTAYYMESTDGITVTADAGISGYRVTVPGGEEQLWSIERVAGSNHADTFTGGDGSDWFDGVGGDDHIDAGGGNDEVNGGAGEDIIDGGTGDDVLSGGSGDDLITPGPGNDRVDGGSNGWGAPDHDVVIYAGANDPVTVEGRFVDLLDDDGNVVGQVYAYSVKSGADVDLLWNVEEVRGTAFNDTMSGSDDGGDDLFVGGAGADDLDGRTGSDTASYAGSGAGAAVSLSSGTGAGGDAEGDTLAGIENLIGSAHADALEGDGMVNRLEGGAGDDKLSGGAGPDTFVFAVTDGAGDGADTITDFEPALDMIEFRSAALVAYAFAAVDADMDGSMDDTRVDYADSSIVLLDVAPGELSEANFSQVLLA